MLRKASRVAGTVSSTRSQALTALLPTLSAFSTSIQPAAAPLHPQPLYTDAARRIHTHQFAAMTSLSLALPPMASAAAAMRRPVSARNLTARAAVAPRSAVSLLAHHTAAGVLSTHRLSQVRPPAISVFRRHWGCGARPHSARPQARAETLPSRTA